MSKLTAYICGKMSGKDDWGKIEFANKEIEAIRRGYNVINPFFLHDEPTTTLEEEVMAGTWDAKWTAYLKADIPHLLKCDFLITTGPDWIESRGARLEVFIAQSLFIPTYGHDWSTLPMIGLEAGFSKNFHKRSEWVKELQDAPLRPGFEDKCNKECGHPMEYPDVSIENILKGYPSQVDYGESIVDVLKKFPEKTTPEPEDVLHEAYRITTGDRNNAYGDPTQDFARTGAMWSAILGTKVTAREVALCMAALKISRACWSNKRDHYVDLAGYARCGWLCAEKEGQDDTN